MSVITITSLNDERLAPYARLTDRALRTPTAGLPIFIIESPKVIAVALRAGYRPLSLLCEQRHLAGDAAPIVAALPPEAPVFTGKRELLARLTGYTLTRGVLCAMAMPPEPTLAQVLQDARRVGVIYDVCDATNVGAIFRSAAALGLDAVVLSDTACHPLGRRVVRVSMGGALLVPWARTERPVEALNDAGFATTALALRPGALPLDAPQLAAQERLAIVLGTEGEGLPPDVIDACRYVVRIPMARNMDSLNVAATAAIAFWQLRSKEEK